MSDADRLAVQHAVDEIAARDRRIADLEAERAIQHEALVDLAILCTFTRAELLDLADAHPAARDRLLALERRIQRRAPGVDDPRGAIDNLYAAVMKS